jgi:hypothetical protein
MLEDSPVTPSNRPFRLSEDFAKSNIKSVAILEVGENGFNAASLW